MKITSLYPIYYSYPEHLEEDAHALEDFGFFIKHHYEVGLEQGYVLENENGNRIDVFTYPKIDSPRGLFGFRVNVDNLDDAIKYAKSYNYTMSTDIIEGENNRSIFMLSQSNIRCFVIEHKK